MEWRRKRWKKQWWIPDCWIHTHVYLDFYLDHKEVVSQQLPLQTSKTQCIELPDGVCHGRFVENIQMDAWLLCTFKKVEYKIDFVDQVYIYYYWSKIYIIIFCLPINTYSNQVEDTWGRTNNINCDINVTENPRHCPIWRYLKWIFICIVSELLN